MGAISKLALNHCHPAKELGLIRQEYAARPDAIRWRVAQDTIDLLWPMAPVSLYYLSGYTGEWYPA